MPPSNFFSSATDIDDDSDEIGDITDFESILDLSSAIFTSKRLLWHYRSHYEELIAFSNAYFYNNNLITFPSSSQDHRGIGVDFLFAGGTFDRKSKTNRKEAELIVEMIFNNIENYPDRSIGVVAFSASQANLIDRLLSKRRMTDSSYEEYFKTDKAEPFFIKNLETVQGDERDTIIFSIAYAPDEQGKFIHNFGPLNRVGGERRLNVAVTRAKENIQVVSSIRYTDINLSNTGSEGAKLLRTYLDYAENGTMALERNLTVSTQDYFDSYFEEEVCEFLRGQGYFVDTQIGCSGYKIDLGLKRSDNSEYVLAIECDGATYHSSKNARDRDRLRQEVLERMGWKFYRIWSTDWFRNKSIAQERLLQACMQATNSITKPKIIKPEPQAEAADFVTEQPDPGNVFEYYKELDALNIFYKYNRDFLKSLREILEAEAPLSDEYYLKRIVPIFDREKVTSAVINSFDYYISGYETYGIIRKNGFMFIKDKEVKLRIPYKDPSTNKYADKRELKYISCEELAEGMAVLIKENISISKDDLYKSLGNFLGFRISASVNSKFDEALNLLISAHRVNVDDNMMISLL